MVHATAPFYSTLIRINPANLSATTDFVCNLCTGMPEPGDSGKTYVFELRTGVKFHDGTPLTVADVKASWDHITSGRLASSSSSRGTDGLQTHRWREPDSNFESRFQKNGVPTRITPSGLTLLGQ
jgi:ABC-type transport system substrate-binding protein